MSAALVAVALLAGCGGGDDDDADAASAATEAVDDADDRSAADGGDDEASGDGECTFVDTATVSQAMGQEMELVLFYDEGCEWRAVADSAIQTFVTLVPEDEYLVDGAEPVEGIGDEAYVRRAIATTSVYFRIGDDRYAIEAGDLNSADSYEEAMLTIARAVAAGA